MNKRFFVGDQVIIIAKDSPNYLKLGEIAYIVSALDQLVYCVRTENPIEIGYYLSEYLAYKTD